MRPRGSKNVKKEKEATATIPISQELKNEIDSILEKAIVETQPIMETIPEIETVTEKAIVADVKPEARREFWEVTKWKGVMDVYKCKNCGHSESGEDKKDQMILHVITHFPKSEQDNLFNKLVKEY
jgi:hypothetical protein